jgi:hypothetical protein
VKAQPPACYFFLLSAWVNGSLAGNGVPPSVVTDRLRVRVVTGIRSFYLLVRLSTIAIRRRIHNREFVEVVTKIAAIPRDKPVCVQLSVCTNQEIGNDPSLAAASGQMPGEVGPGQRRTLLR